MLPHAAYKVLHLLGIFLLLGSFGGLWALSGAAESDHRMVARRWLMASHGVALLLVLFAGFGMLARLGIMGAWPTWVWIKLAIWLSIGALPVVLRRVQRASGPLFYLAPLLAAIAAWAAVFRVGEVL